MQPVALHRQGLGSLRGLCRIWARIYDKAISAGLKVAPQTVAWVEKASEKNDYVRVRFMIVELRTDISRESLARVTFNIRSRVRPVVDPTTARQLEQLEDPSHHASPGWFVTHAQPFQPVQAVDLFDANRPALPAQHQPDAPLVVDNRLLLLFLGQSDCRLISVSARALAPPAIIRCPHMTTPLTHA
jgi:hypothetical protein